MGWLQSWSRWSRDTPDSLMYFPREIPAIRILHLEVGLPNPLNDKWIFSTVMKGIAKTKRISVKQKLPITLQLLLMIKGQLNLDTAHHKIIWAACLILFFPMLMKSNVFPQSLRSFDPTKHLRRCDFLIHPDGLVMGLVMKIRWTKTIQYKDRILECPLPRLKDHPLCHVQVNLKSFQCMTKVVPEGPSFMTQDKSGKPVPLYYKDFIANWNQMVIIIQGTVSGEVAHHGLSPRGSQVKL